MLTVKYRHDVLLPKAPACFDPSSHLPTQWWDSACSVFLAFDGCGNWGRGDTVDEAKAQCRRVRRGRSGRARWAFLRIDGDPRPVVDMFGYVVTHGNARIVDVDAQGSEVLRAARR